MVWKFGAACMDITPQRPQFMMGYYRPERSKGVYHPLHAKTLYMTDGEAEALLIAADLIGFQQADVKRYRMAIINATGIPGDRIILSATHTHTGPRISERVCWDGAADGAYLDELEHAFVSSALEARRTARVGRMKFSRVRSKLGVNRRRWENGRVVMKPNPEGSHDRQADTRWISDRKGKMIATVTAYGCHATVLGGYLIGADYPGYFKDAVEDAVGGMALWSSGCGGDVRPWFTGSLEEFGGRTVAHAEQMGRAHAKEVLAGRKNALDVELGRLCVSSRTVRLPLQKAYSEKKLREVFGEKTIKEIGETRLREIARRGRAMKSVPCEVQVLTLNRAHHLVYWGGETCAEVGRGLKDHCPAWIVTPHGCANAATAYIPSENMFLQGGYEVEQSLHYYLLGAPFVPNTQDYLWRASLDLMKAHRNRQRG